MTHSRSAFELSQSALESDPSVIYALDADFRIRYCNAAWDAFALANGGAQWVRGNVKGRNLFEFVSGGLADYYKRSFAEVLRTGKPWHTAYECSSAEAERRFTMHVHPTSGTKGLLVVNSLVVQHPHRRKTADAIRTVYREPSGQIVMCSNCRRTRRAGSGGVWDWVPAFVASHLPEVSHGLCPPCLECYYPGLL
jgi:hypothetical protein